MRSRICLLAYPREMAEDGGYDYECVEPAPEDFTCTVCRLLLRDPVLTGCCGNHFCRTCCQRVHRCPLCNSSGLAFSTFPDKYFSRKISELRVHCPFTRRGCKWKGELALVAKHVDQETGSCQFTVVYQTCRMCKNSIPKEDMAEHRAKVCPERPFVCQYCGQRGNYRTVSQRHWPRCDRYPVECPNQCGAEGLVREDVEDHLDEDCPLMVVECEFADNGCEVQLPRRDMAQHLRDASRTHAALRGQALYPPLSRTMKNFPVHKASRRKWYSEPFYSHPGGYKLCFGVYANGVGQGGGTHVSVFVNLMKGVFDSELEWPFKGEVDFAILFHDKVIRETIKFVTYGVPPIILSAAYQVTKGTRNNMGQGIARCIAHSSFADAIPTSLTFLVRSIEC